MGPLPHVSVHAVRFYQDSTTLGDLVADFVRGGLEAGDGAVIVATPAHLERIAYRLGQHGIDASRYEQSGDLVRADANQTLTRILIDDTPNRARFLATIRPVLDRASRQQTRRVRVYGEMVDVLWKSQRTRAAIHLEELWNDLGRSMPFSLLCGYSTASTYEGSAVDDICGQHSHVVSESGLTTPLS